MLGSPPKLSSPQAVRMLGCKTAGLFPGDGSFRAREPPRDQAAATSVELIFVSVFLVLPYLGYISYVPCVAGTPPRCAMCLLQR